MSWGHLCLVDYCDIMIVAMGLTDFYIIRLWTYLMKVIPEMCLRLLLPLLSQHSGKTNVDIRGRENKIMYVFEKLQNIFFYFYFRLQK